MTSSARRRWRSNSGRQPDSDRRWRAVCAKLSPATCSCASASPTAAQCSARGRRTHMPSRKVMMRGRASGELAQRPPLAVVHRQRAIDAARRKVLHQAEEEGQVVRRHALLVERQDEAARLGVHEIVRVLDALGDALAGEQRADVVAGDEGVKLFVGGLRCRPPWPTAQCRRRGAGAAA